MKSSFFQSHKLAIIVVLFLLFLVGYIISDKYQQSPAVQEFTLNDLKDKLDTIKNNQLRYEKTISLIDKKIDSVDTKYDQSKTNITNIYKTEVNEKAKLNKASDSVNYNYFINYVNQWIRTNNDSTSTARKGN